MAVWKMVEFCVPKAQPLADLTGVEVDLKITVDICDLLLEKYNEEQQRVDLYEYVTCKEALCAAALIRYVRSFASGVRMGVPEDIIISLTPEQQKSHAYFKDLRNKWIAHSVYAYDENKVYAHPMPEERGTRSISRISVQHGRVISLNEEDIIQLKSLAQEVRLRVADKIKLENQKVLEYARSLPVDVFYDQEVSPYKCLCGDTKKVRRKF